MIQLPVLLQPAGSGMHIEHGSSVSDMEDCASTCIDMPAACTPQFGREEASRLHLPRMRGPSLLGPPLPFPPLAFRITQTPVAEHFPDYYGRRQHAYKRAGVQSAAEAAHLRRIQVRRRCGPGPGKGGAEVAVAWLGG